MAASTITDTQTPAGAPPPLSAHDNEKRAAALIRDVCIALTGSASLNETLDHCARALVEHLDAAFARIWVLDDSQQVLELRASAGMYTHLDGPHSRVPLGQLKIGLIGQERRPHLTNSVIGDPRVSDQDWARRERMVAFAGHPLLIEDRLVGVMALFARHVLADATLDALASVADGIALGIERRRAEQALRDSEQFARAVIDSLGARIAILDDDGRIVMANRAWQTHAAHRPACWCALYPGGDYLAACDAAAQAGHSEAGRTAAGIRSLLKRESLELLCEHCCATDPVPCWVEGRARMLSTGTDPRLVLAYHDVTPTKLDREALRASEERFRFALDAARLGVWDWNARTDALTWSAGLDRMHGLEPCQTAASYEDFLRLVHPEDREAVRHEVQRSQAERRLYDFEHRILTPEGEVRWLAGKGRHFYNEAGEPVRMVGIAMDITAAKYAQAELERARKAAEAANRAKSEFIANMSHEIRTPMTAILGHAELLLDPQRDAAERIESALAIQRNGRHLLEIINDTLDISKIDAGKLEVERVPCSPSRIIAEVVSMMRVRASERGLLFHVEYAGAIPETIRTDPTRLRQVLVNLVGNAIKFTERGHVRLVCSLAGAAPHPTKERPAGAASHLAEAGRGGLAPNPPTPRLRFDVIDTGIGIAPDQLERLFHPFTQADGSAVRKFAGTGLGLAISRRLAHALGGEIEVVSELGAGSTFSFFVETGPLDGVSMLDRPHECDEPAPAHEAAALPQRCLEGRRILLAEDGEDNLFLIALHLKRAGAKVEVARNGRIAVAKARRAMRKRRPHDLILMDMQMPKMDGYAATAQLRAEGFSQPVIALTAHTMRGDRERCLAMGCDDYAAKPINRRDLLAVVVKHLEDTSPQRPRRHPPTRSTRSDKQPACRDHPPARSPASRIPRASGSSPAGDPLVSEFADDPEMAQAVRRFVARLDALAREVDGALLARDAPRLATLAHRLKGAAGGYGFPSISHAAAALQRQATASDWSATVALAQDLLDLCRRAARNPSTSPPVEETPACSPSHD